MTRCSICHALIHHGDDRVTCSECRQEYHRSCWDGIGGCATYGCTAAPAPVKAPPPEGIGEGWGDDKACPACSARIASSLLVCRCGARFPYADPMTAEEHAEWKRRESDVATARRLLVLLFFLSLLVVTAPILGAVAGAYAHGRRESLAGPGGAFLAMGYGTAALGAVYGIIMVLLGLGL